MRTILLLYIGRSSWKFKYISKKVWKIGFFENKNYKKRILFKDNLFLKKHLKYTIGTMDKFRLNIVNKSSTIPYFFINKTVRIYKGKSWTSLFISKWHIGLKFGQFSTTRKYVQYKSKALKKTLKKQNKNQKENIPQVEDPRIQQLKLIRTGQLSKRLVNFSELNKKFIFNYRNVLK